MDRTIFVQNHIITEEENARMNEETRMINEHSDRIAETLQKDYQLYYETCSELWLKEQEELRKIQHKVQSEGFCDVYSNKKFTGRVKQIFEEMTHDEYPVLMSIKKLVSLYMKIQDVEKEYLAEKKSFLNEVRKALGEDQWQQYKQYFSDNRLFNKLCNEDLIA